MAILPAAADIASMCRREKPCCVLIVFSRARVFVRPTIPHEQCAGRPAISRPGTTMRGHGNSAVDLPELPSDRGARALGLIRVASLYPIANAPAQFRRNVMAVTPFRAPPAGILCDRRL